MTEQQQYKDLYRRTMKAMTWIDSSDRNPDEVKKWNPKLKAMFDELTRMELKARRDAKQ